MSVSNAATNTVTTLLGTISTAANVTNAALNSANIAALDLQARVQDWSTTAAIERKLNALDSTEVAIENHAIKRVTRVEERTTWFKQNPDREAAFQAAVESARLLLATP